MKNNKAKLLAVAVAMGMSAHASAAIELYNQDGTTFSADGHFNAFYVHTDADDADTTTPGDQPEDQSRVRMGFLPNWIGFNVSKQVDGLKLGGRSSFWITINDGGASGATDTAIDVRQFYGTVDGDFGQVLFGKDFGLYARSNIFSDELLLGTGLPQPNTGGVTFGNISVGYPYATPNAQITYRTPVTNGFQLAVGILDPDNGQAVGRQGEDARFEAEATYMTEFDGGKFNAWLGAATGESSNDGRSVEGIAYGARIAMNGFQFTASGYDQEGIGALSTDTNSVTSNDDSDGYLVQASYAANGHRVVLSHGESETNGQDSVEMQTIAYFYDINSNLKLIAEYDQAETGAGKETDQFAIGAALSW